MGEERKMLYMAIGINFLFGIILGIVLFFGQMRTDASVFESGHTYDTSITVSDFIRVSWQNVLWLFAIFTAHNVLPASIFHPIMTLRGCSCAFSVMYILNFVGVAQAAAAALPQCMSVLPLMAVFSAETVIRRKKRIRNGNEPFSMNRKEVVIILLLSMLSGGAELIFFRIFTLFLF